MKISMVAYTNYEQDNRVRRYAEALATRGDSVDVIVLKQPGQPDVDELKGVRIYRIQKRNDNERLPTTYLFKLLLFMVRSAVLLAKNSMKGRYDLVHVHSVPDFEVFAACIPKLLGAKIILDIHDIVPEFYAYKFRKNRESLVFRMLKVMEKLSIAFSDHVIIANHIWQETLLSRSVTKEKCTVVLNYPDLAIFSRNGRKRNDGKFIMIYPGTLHWHQGIDIAIRGFKKIADKYPGAEFHIYGDGGKKKSLLELIEQEGLKGRVMIKGVLTMEGIAAAMSEADLGVVPKRADSFGNEAFSTKIFEFMAMGVPVLASSTKIDRFYFDDSKIMFFHSEDVDDLASKMERLINDMDLRTRLVKNSGAYIAENNWDVKRNEYFRLLENLVP
jgi:glycosyltransferase involved in cell wall biosynthesis